MSIYFAIFKLFTAIALGRSELVRIFFKTSGRAFSIAIGYDKEEVTILTLFPDDTTLD